MHIRDELLEVNLHADLYEAGWNGLDVQHPSATPRQFAMSSLAKSLLKKFHNDKTDEKRDELALALFLQCNQRCKDFPGVVPRRLDEEYIIGEMKSLLWDFFNPPFEEIQGPNVFHQSREPLLLNLSDIATHFGLGRGSNIGTRSTDFYSKYVLSAMSHTNPVLPSYFRQAIAIDPLWSEVETIRAKRFGYAMAEGSRLSFVPKSREISRVICTEPILNMFFQIGIKGVLEKRLLEVSGIDFEIQPSRNRRLAQVGSVTGKFGTIDLSSASDTISLNLLRDILPAQVLNWLLLCRSNKTILPNGESIDLHMISSMGNGYTFPLQTIIFYALVASVYKIYGIKLVKPNSRPIRDWSKVPHLRVFDNSRRQETDGTFAVFGDDIIVDSRVYDVTCRCLDLLGFRVNLQKSFNQGHFRESCGSDFWSGYNIRGVYIKTLRDDMDSYSAINRLIKWSAFHGILLRRSVSYLRAGCRFIGVPYDEADDAGIKIPLSLLRKPSRDINGAIHYLACVNTPLRLRLPQCDAADGSPEWLVERHGSSLRFSRWSGRIRHLPHFEYFPSGMLLLLVAGHLQDGCLGVRSTRRKAVLRKRRSPGWVNAPFAVGESRRFAEHWEMFCIANLGN
jgi:hypothetical protein